MGTVGVKVMAQPPTTLKLEVLTAHAPVTTAPPAANAANATSADAAAVAAVPAAVAAVAAAFDAADGGPGSNVVDKLGYVESMVGGGGGWQCEGGFGEMIRRLFGRCSFSLSLAR